MKKAIELLEDAKSGLETTAESVGFFSRETIQDMLFAVGGILDEVIAELQAPPRWETPEQWEKRTGDRYPGRAPVWCADNDDHADPWFLDYYENAMNDERYYIICAVGGLVPPDDWRPEEGVKVVQETF